MTQLETSWVLETQIFFERSLNSYCRFEVRNSGNVKKTLFYHDRMIVLFFFPSKPIYYSAIWQFLSLSSQLDLGLAIWSAKRERLSIRSFPFSFIPSSLHSRFATPSDLVSKCIYLTLVKGLMGMDFTFRSDSRFLKTSSSSIHFTLSCLCRLHFAFNSLRILIKTELSWLICPFPSFRDGLS